MQATINDLIIAARDRLDTVTKHLDTGKVQLALHDLGDILFWITLVKVHLAARIEVDKKTREIARDPDSASWREVLGGT